MNGFGYRTLGTLVLLLALASAAAAQPPEPSENPFVAETQALFEDIERLRAEYTELVEQEQKLLGDERAVVALQARQRVVDFIRTVDKLVATALRHQGEGPEAEEILERTRKLAAETDERLPKFFDLVLAENAEYRDSLAKATPEEAPDFEDRIKAHEEMLDETVRFAISHVNHLEGLGMDPAQAREAAATRLEDRAENLASRLALARRRLDAAKSEQKAAPGDSAAQATVSLAREALDRIAASLLTTCDMLDKLDISTAEYRQALIQTTGEISTDVFNWEVVTGLAEDSLVGARRWLEQRGPTLLGKLGLFAGIMTLFWLAGRLTRHSVARLIRSSSLSELARRIILSTVSRVVFILGFFVALSQMGINVTALVAGLGIAGFIIGFALQETLGNFASGAMILMYRPFDVGDVIEAGGVSGQVHTMNLVSTTILTFDNQTLVVPNNKIWGNVIRNVTDQKTRRVDLSFPLTHDVDVPRVEELFLEMCREHPSVLAEPEPAVWVNELTESAVIIVVRPWVKTSDYWTTRWNLYREAKVRLAAAGIPMGAQRHEVAVKEKG